MNARLRRLLLVLAAFAAAAAVAVPAVARTSTGHTTFLDEVAARLGVAPAKLRKAIQDTASARGEQPFGHHRAWRQHDGEMHWWHDGRFEPRDHAVRRSGFAAAARYIGLSPPALFAELKAGTTLASIAAAKQLPVDGLEQAMLKPLQTRLEQAVAAGRMTKDQAARIESSAAERIHELVRHGFGPPTVSPF